MTDHVHLYVIAANPEQANTLEVELTGLPQVTVLQEYADAVNVSRGLDAVFVPLMSAMEWGVIKPPAPLHQTRVVKMPDYEVARGRPPYAIPNVAISPGEFLNPTETTQLILRESFKAIHCFNEAGPPKLRAVCVSTFSLG